MEPLKEDSVKEMTDDKHTKKVEKRIATIDIPHF
jgi:hypothetical protein